MKMRFTFALFVSVLPFSAAFCQISLDKCQKEARQNYPQVKQFDLISKSSEYNLSNAGKTWLPQLSLSARATYQSETTTVNVPKIGLDIALPKDQYQAVLEVDQVIWDGGVTSSQKSIIKAGADIDKEKLEVELYNLRDRVNQLFFGILLIKEQIAQNETLQNELQTNYDKILTYIANGVANQSDADAVKVECLNNGQRKLELESSLKSYLQMLSAMTGENIQESTSFEKPLPDYSYNASDDINRPEVKFYDSQMDLFEKQENMIHAGNMPKFGAFLQGGYGNPGLNMFKTGFSPYFIGGLRLSWNFGSLYTQSNNLRSLKNSREMVSVQKETFLFNNRLNVSRQSNEIEKLRNQLKSDDEIISLRESIKKAGSVKVEHGTMSVSDFLRDIYSESLARSQKSLHEIQLLINIYNLKYSVNN